MTAYGSEIQLAGFFTIQSVRNGVVVNQASFPNLITNAGLIRATLNSSDPSISALPIEYAMFGTGTTPPTAVDVDLTTPHGLFSGMGNIASRKKYTKTGAEVIAGSSSTPLGYQATTWTFTFAAGDVPMGELGEIGIFWEDPDTAEKKLWSKALIRNDAGNPTTFSVDGDEVLYVRYELRKYVPEDVTGTVTIAGENYNYLIRPFNVNGDKWNADAPVFGALMNTFTNVFDQPLVDVHLASHGNPAAAPGRTTVIPHEDGKMYRDITIKWEALEGLVPGGIKKIGGAPYTPFGSIFPVTDLSNYQIEFSPPIPKDDRHRLSITFRYTLSYKAV